MLSDAEQIAEKARKDSEKATEILGRNIEASIHEKTSRQIADMEGRMAKMGRQEERLKVAIDTLECALKKAESQSANMSNIITANKPAGRRRGS